MMEILKKLLRPTPPGAAAPAYGFIGDYLSFEDAAAEATGYETDACADHSARSLRAVIESTPCVVLDERFMQVHSALSYIGQRERMSALSVVDYGGGSAVYAKVMRQLMPATSFEWTILESPAVAAACAVVEGAPAKFISAFNGQVFDVAVISGSLQYLPEPWKALEEIARHAKWLILTRLPVVAGDADRVTLQKVPPHLFQASMPVWLLSEQRVREWIGDRLAIEWTVSPDAGVCAMQGAVAKGFLIGPHS